MAEQKKKYSELTEEEKAALSEEELNALKAEEETVEEKVEEQPVETTEEAMETKEETQDPATEPTEEVEPEVEETITLKKSEYEELLKNKFAEGARKTEKTLQEQIVLLQEENNALKAKDVAGILVLPEFVDDLIYLTKGKGLEVNEANLKEVAATQPYWQKSTEAILKEQAKIGASGSDTPAKPDDKEIFKNTVWK